MTFVRAIFNVFSSGGMRAIIVTEQQIQLQGRRCWVAGHLGMVGSALARQLTAEGAEILTVTRAELDLTRQSDVERWIDNNRPDWVFVAAAKVGGIYANNNYPAEFIYQNLAICTNIVHGAYKSGVGKLLMLGSSCSYPVDAPQPMPEEALGTGRLEPTNEWYATAKIAAIKMCEAYRRQYGCDFISAMPTNLYGPGDNFDPMNSHVIPALMQKIHLAKIENHAEVELWGTGKPVRDFMYVDDMAGAAIFLMRTYSDVGHINVGTGEGISIRDLAEVLAEIIGYEGGFRFDSSKPDGMPEKILQSARLYEMGWRPSTGLREGLCKAYQWFLGDNPATAG